MTKKMTTIAIVLMTLFVGAAYAAATIGLDDLNKNVPIGGSVHFTVTLNTDTAGDLKWSAANPPISATMDGDSSGSISVSPGETTHDFEVFADTTAVQGKVYKLKLIFLNEEQDIEAVATGSVEPIPELNTMALTSLGVIGLLGMVMFRRRD